MAFSTMNETPAGTIHLLRHGETEGGARYRGSTDDALTPRGWEQMWAAVGENTWDRIVASPLARCAAFAQALAERRGIPLEIDERLGEMHFGAWEGRSAAELMAEDADALARFWQNPAAYPPPGAEPLPEFQARVLAAWREVVRDSAGQRVLLVSHGGPMRVILCEIRRHPIERLLEIEVAHAALVRGMPISDKTRVKLSLSPNRLRPPRSALPASGRGERGSAGEGILHPQPPK